MVKTCLCHALTPFSGFSSRYLSDLQGGVRSSCPSPRPSWLVSGSWWLDPSRCWWWGRDGPTHSPARDLLRDEDQHPASSTLGKGKDAERVRVRVQSFCSASALWLVPENSNALGRLGLGCSHICTHGLQGSAGGLGQLGRGASAAAAAHQDCAQTRD